MRRTQFAILLALPVVFGPAFLLAQADKEGEKRAKPPKWNQSVSDVFFPDAREQLVGERPQFGASAASSTKSGDNSSEPGNSGPAAKGSFAWSKIITPDALGDEIKAQKPVLADGVKSPSVFKSKGYKDARRAMTLLATCFAIVAEHDGDVRWKNQAVGAREVFARSAFNPKADDTAFKESRKRLEDLDSLISGGMIQAPPDSEPKTRWHKVADRRYLMARMEQAQQQGLTPWTASKGEFTKNSPKLMHEAMVLAALAEVIGRDGFEYAEDESYQEYAKHLKQHCLEVVEAVKAKDLEKARRAAAEAGKSCTQCHGDFRA